MSKTADCTDNTSERPTWQARALDEAETFPNGGHDDQIDAVSGAGAHVNRPPALAFMV